MTALPPRICGLIFGDQTREKHGFRFRHLLHGTGNNSSTQTETSKRLTLLVYSKISARYNSD
jgi:hypothetical protein